MQSVGQSRIRQPFVGLTPGRRANHFGSRYSICRRTVHAAFAGSGQRFGKAGVADADEYSGHSLRRGFANWAAGDGWDTKSLMEYIGWKSAQSAMRYIDSSDRFAQYRATKVIDLKSSA